MKNIILTERQMSEIKKALLSEDKASDFIKKMIKNNVSPSLQPYLNTLVSELPQNMQQHFSQACPSIYASCLKNNMNLTALLRLNFLSYFDISHGKGPVEYIMGIARVAIGELGMFNEGSNDSDLALLKQLVLFAHNTKTLSVNIDSNLNGWDFKEIKENINAERKSFNAQNRKNLSSVKLSQNDYDIIPILSYEQASKYSQYTTWCVTHGENAFSSYTNGGRRFYFCLKHGFENVPYEKGDSAPLDKYGLSMVSILVDMDGEPNYITTRWNHTYDGENNENFHTAEQVQKILGINFYNTFKPYSREELHAMGIMTFEEVEERLANGEDPHNIFGYLEDEINGLCRVSLNGKYNFINNENHLISHKWFDDCYFFKNGFSEVELNGKYNIMNTEGVLLSDSWFDDVEICGNKGVAALIKLNGSWNLINAKGSLLSNTWFDNVKICGNNGVAALIKLNGSWNLINAKGSLLSNMWFNNIDTFTNELFLVEIKEMCNLMNTEGKLLFDEWFDEIYTVLDNHFYVTLDGKCNIINIEGNFLSDTWFDTCGVFHNGVAVVSLNGKWNFINSKGLLFNKWFDDMQGVWGVKGLLKCEINGKWNLITVEGEFLSDVWFDRIGNVSTNGKFIQVKLNGEIKCVDLHGNLYSDSSQIFPFQLSETKKKKKTPSIYDQVKKVNAGIMDAVTCGEMCEEGAEPESDTYHIGFEENSNNEYGHICESIDAVNYDYKSDIISIAKFMRNEGLNVYPYPKVRLNWEDQDGLFIKTGYYEPSSRTIVIFCNERHPKDILRTFAHEMIHHHQNLSGKNLNYSSNDDVKDNKALEEIEGEAYLKGNIYFRKWTEYEKKKEVLRENVESEMTAWHGTIATFDKFDTSFMGKGEGNQSYGWGIYVSGNRETGLRYANTIASNIDDNSPISNGPWGLIINSIDAIFRGNKYKNRFIDNIYHYIFNIFPKNTKNLPEVMDEIKLAQDLLTRYPLFDKENPEADMSDTLLKVRDYAEARLNSIERTPQILYQVEIPDDNGNNYIEWKGSDENAFEALIECAISIFKKYRNDRDITEKYIVDTIWGDASRFATVYGTPTCGDVYSEASHFLAEWHIDENSGERCDKLMSLSLAERGYVGFKVPVANKKGGNGELGYNYIIFKEDNVKIIKRSQMNESIADAISVLPCFSYYNDNGVREICHAIKDGDISAIKIAAKEMAKNVSPSDTLVPIPSRNGIATITLTLANEIAKISGARVMNSLSGRERESFYNLKKQGIDVDEKFFDYRTNGKIDPSTVILVDNVFDTGKTAKAAAKAIGAQRVLVFAKTDNSLMEDIVLEDVRPSDIDLSSFNIKKNLNPKFWKDGHLDSRVRMKLLDLADDFIEFLGVDWVKPDDVIMTGSLANFNWNDKYSDIDLHILMDFSKVDKRTDFVENYFYSQKKIWNDEHKELKIFGFPVEFYVQDVKAEHKSTGVYSIDKDKWISEPERERLSNSKVNKSFIKEKVSEYANKIENLCTIYKEAEGDGYKVRKVAEKAEALFNSIKNERAKGLKQKDNEISNGNIIFKSLRRLGYIEKLIDLKAKSYDKMNSIS